MSDQSDKLARRDLDRDRAVRHYFEEKGSKHGPSRRRFCKRGHDKLAVNGAYVSRQGIVHCFLCKKAQWSVYRSPKEKVRVWRQSWREQNRDAIRAYDRMFYARNPEKKKEQSKRWQSQNKARLRELRKLRRQRNTERDREREREHARQWARNNPEKIRAIRKRTYQKNAERRRRDAREAYARKAQTIKFRAENAARTMLRYHTNPSYKAKCIASAKQRLGRFRRAPGHYTAEQWLARIMFYGWKCRYCRVLLTADTITQDHQIPLIRGGSNWPANLVPCCKTCNSKKRTKTAKEFLLLCPQI